MPRLGQVPPQRGGGDRRERLLGVDGVVLELADEIRRQVHLELSHFGRAYLVSHKYYGTKVPSPEAFSPTRYHRGPELERWRSQWEDQHHVKGVAPPSQVDCGAPGA